MQYKFLIFSTILAFSLASCKDKTNSVYDGCCGMEPTLDTFHFNLMVTDNNGQLIDSTFKASVYIPNIIVIDSFGADYSLFVFGSTAVNKIISFTCLDEQGNTLFAANNVLPNDFNSGWNGVKPDGTLYKGVFNYQAVVEFINGQQKTYNGKSCIYHCKDDDFPNANLPDCFFPSQHDGNGGLDPNLPPPLQCF